MKVVNTSIAITLVSALLACGQVPTEDQTATKAAKDKEGKDNVEESEYEGQANLTGYLANAFDVVVDGQKYEDTEDYYTQKLEQLTAEAEASGYEGWTLSFDAEIGLDDLKYGMMVFASAAGNRGYAGQVPMEFNGSFSMEIPENSRNAVYSVRANKKVNVTLTPPESEDGSANEKPVRWCYNFSAQLAGITLGAPVILNTFESRLTKYACSVERDGIEIPTKRLSK